MVVLGFKVAAHEQQSITARSFLFKFGFNGKGSPYRGKLRSNFCRERETNGIISLF